MKKENFISLILGTAGGMLFALGMCMTLLPEWNTFKEGIAMGAAGLIVLLVMVLVRRKMLGKAPIRISGKTIGATLLGIFGALTLGVGMCMCMVWEGLMIQGILVGILGIVLLLCLIPLCKGLE